MKLRVQYTAQMRTAAGKSEDLIELPDASTLSALLAHLAIQLGQTAASHLLSSSGHPHQSLLILLNDALVPSHDAPITLLHNDDLITLLPPIAGG